MSRRAAGRDRRQEFGAQQRREVAREQQFDELVARTASVGARGRWPSIARPCRRRAIHALCTSRARSATGLAVMCAHAVEGAQLAQDARDRSERGALERFRPVGRNDRVEHQRFDVIRVVLGVLLRDLGAVAGAVQHELFIAARLADRLDVGDRIGGRVEAAAGPELVAARFDQRAERVGTGRGVRRRGRKADRRGRCRAGRRRSDRASAAIGPSSSANSSANGSAGWPGPPASAMIALRASPTGARWRRIASVIVPGVAPAGVQRHGQMPARELVAVLARRERDLCVGGGDRADAGRRAHPRARRRQRDRKPTHASHIHRNLLSGAAPRRGFHVGRNRR